MWSYAKEAIEVLSNFMSLLASLVVVYLFIFKRSSVTSIISFITNYSFQLSLSELKEKLEKLNDYSAKEDSEREKIVNILHDVSGQIRGNPKLTSHFADQISEIELISSNTKRLTEPKKRALVSELKEKLRTLNIENIDDLVGGANEQNN